MKTKILSLYLPQFHRTDENDKWWGKGFTEWNVVRKANACCRFSIQPRIPLDGYYDLSEKKSIRRQVELANEYGVDGFVFYSYYSNGTIFLDKPLNILLNDPTLKIGYCLSWANHDWLRTWFSYNREMLRKQEYASTEKEIEEHFMYLLTFFKDDRYIKINNRPVFFIYNYKCITNFDKYYLIWNKLAIKYGFSGVFFVQTLSALDLIPNDSFFDASFDYEPTYTTFLNMKLTQRVNRFKRAVKKILRGKFITNYFEYKTVCKKMIKRLDCKPNHWLGAFAEWDNTPRHSHNGTVFKKFSIELFEKQLFYQYKKSVMYEKPFLVIDAWNEWGEGAFLEPDTVYGYQKLETIKKVKDKFTD